MATKISRAWLNTLDPALHNQLAPALHGLLDAIDALIANDLEFGGHIGIGRPPTEVPLHVSQTVVAVPGVNTTTLQVDTIVTGGVGGVHVALKSQAIAGPDWDGTGGQIFGSTSEGATSAKKGTGEVWGGQWHAKALIGAGSGNEVCGGEIDVVAEVPVKTRVGLFIGAMPEASRSTKEGHQATGLDSVFVFTNKDCGATWMAGLTFLQAHPTLTRFPIDQNGVFFTATPSTPTRVKDWVNLSHHNLIFSGNAYSSQGFKVDGDGLVTVAAPQAEVVLDDPGGRRFSVRSSVGAFSVRDKTRGTDRLRIDHNGTLEMWPSQGVVTETVTPDTTLILRLNGADYKLCLKKMSP